MPGDHLAFGAEHGVVARPQADVEPAHPPAVLVGEYQVIVMPIDHPPAVGADRELNGWRWVRMPGAGGKQGLREQLPAKTLPLNAHPF